MVGVLMSGELFWIGDTKATESGTRFGVVGRGAPLGMPVKQERIFERFAKSADPLPEPELVDIVELDREDLERDLMEDFRLTMSNVAVWGGSEAVAFPSYCEMTIIS